MTNPNPAGGAAETVAQQHPQEGHASGRKEVGTAASSRRDPPHVDANASSATVQKDAGNPTKVPTLPANAGGKDKVTTAEQNRGIDDASMYDRRPEEDKNRPPSERTSG